MPVPLPNARPSPSHAPGADAQPNQAWSWHRGGAGRLLVAVLAAVLVVGQPLAAVAQTPVAPAQLAQAAPTDETPAAPTAAPATAAARPKVLILRAESAVAPDAVRIAATKDIHAQALKYRQLDVALSAADLVEEMFEFECTEAGVECLSRIGGKYGAQLVVYTDVNKNAAGSLQLSMRLVDVAQARMAQSTQQAFDAGDRPGAAAARALVVLLGPVDLPQSEGEAPGTLHIVLFGGGVALVYVDEKLAGRTSVSGLKVLVPAGTHPVRVVRAGYREWKGRITVAAGQTVEQAVQLEQLAEAPPVDPLAGGKPVAVPLTHKWWFWAGIVVVAAAAAGVTYALTSEGGKVQTGTAAFSMDHLDAYLDPVFAGGAP